jgi:hypothetical protein
MTTKTTFFQKLKGFFSRLLVLQMSYLWLVMKFSQIDKSCNDFKTRVMKTLNHFNIKGSFVNLLFDDPIFIHLALTLSELVFSILALFGSRLGIWIIALQFSLTTFLFFNPFLPENSFSLWKFDIRHDMLSSFGVVACFFMIAYYPDTKDSNSHLIEEIDEDDNLIFDTIKEPVKSTQTQTKKSKK